MTKNLRESLLKHLIIKYRFYFQNKERRAWTFTALPRPNCIYCSLRSLFLSFWKRGLTCPWGLCEWLDRGSKGEWGLKDKLRVSGMSKQMTVPLTQGVHYLDTFFNRTETAWPQPFIFCYHLCIESSIRVIFNTASTAVGEAHFPDPPLGRLFIFIQQLNTHPLNIPTASWTLYLAAEATEVNDTWCTRRRKEVFCEHSRLSHFCPEALEGSTEEMKFKLMEN